MGGAFTGRGYGCGLCYFFLLIEPGLRGKEGVFIWTRGMEKDLFGESSVEEDSSDDEVWLYNYSTTCIN